MVAYLLVGTYVLPWYLAWGLPVLAVVWRWRIGWLVLIQAAVLQLATARPPSAAVADPLSVGSPLGRFQLDLYTVGAPLLEVALVVIVIVMMVMTVAGIEEFRLDLENTVQIERAALQHVGQRHLAALGAVQLGVGVDAADPRFDFGQLCLGDEIRLVEHDDVGERDLVLGFRRVL